MYYYYYLFICLIDELLVVLLFLLYSFLTDGMYMSAKIRIPSFITHVRIHSIVYMTQEKAFT